jgi:hypothetical protein
MDGAANRGTLQSTPAFISSPKDLSHGMTLAAGNKTEDSTPGRATPAISLKYGE